jgi:hypothetical protein
MLNLKTIEFSLRISPSEYNVINNNPTFDAQIECTIYHLSSRFKYNGGNTRLSIVSFNCFINDVEKMRKGETSSAILPLGSVCRYEIHFDKTNIEYPLMTNFYIKEYRNIQNDTELSCSFKSNVDFINILYNEFVKFKFEYDEQIKMQCN